MRRGFIAVMLLLAAAAPGAARARDTAAITVFAAASLMDVLREIGALWAARGHIAPRFSFAASSTLARQIEQGGRVHLFASADEPWMDYLVARGLIAVGTQRSLLSNRLVLIVPRVIVPRVIVPNVPGRGAAAQGLDIPARLGVAGRLAIGDPRHVPAGIYAEQALRKLGLWEQLAPRLARTENARAALLLVERGEAPAGIVYATDAMGAPGVAVAGLLPADSHARITYPFALTREGDTMEARAFLDFLSSDAARAVFLRHGFLLE